MDHEHENQQTWWELWLEYRLQLMPRGFPRVCSIFRSYLGVSSAALLVLVLGAPPALLSQACGCRNASLNEL